MKKRYGKRPIRPPKAVRVNRLKWCKSGKKSFRTLTDAKIFLARMQLKRKNGCHMGYHKIPIRAYFCSYCGHYHVTSRAEWHN